MSDDIQQPEPDGAWGEWGVEEQAAAPSAAPLPPVLAALPQPQRENHALTLSVTADGKSPMLVYRADSAQELNALLTQVEMAGCWANIASHQQAVRAHGTLGAGMPGQVQAAPQQPMQVTPQGIPMHPQAQFGAPLGAGGAPGTAPAQWQNAGAPAPAPAGCSGLPGGWYKVNIPFQSKAAGDAIKENLKAQGLYQGNMRWCAGAKHWHVSPNVVGAFGQFGPTQ